MTDLSPEVTTSYEYPWMTQNHIYVFSMPLLMAALSLPYSVLSFRLGEKRGTLLESSWNSFGFFIGFIYFIYIHL